mgnify:CR=1 FL=1
MAIIIKAANSPLHIAPFIPSFLMLFIAISNFLFSKLSFTKVFTFLIPDSASRSTLLDRAEASCAFFESFFINLPKITAEIAITGTIASITRDSFQEIKAINEIPKINR